jgi:Mn-dependent DtxR family transcriptional regulator
MKMSQLKMVIREVVREEIRMGLKEVLGGVKKQPVQKPKPKQKQDYSKNPVLNEVLNNTEIGQDWETMGGTTYTSERMSELIGNPSSDEDKNTNGNLAREMGVSPNDPAAGFLKKDYRELMSAVDKKRGK